MSEREKKSGGAGCFIWCGVLIMLPILYVLGIGPAVWLVKIYPSTEKWLGVIYYPLALAAEQFPQVGEVLIWYLTLWGA